MGRRHENNLNGWVLARHKKTGRKPAFFKKNIKPLQTQNQAHPRHFLDLPCQKCSPLLATPAHSLPNALEQRFRLPLILYPFRHVFQLHEHYWATAIQPALDPYREKAQTLPH
jgi:hypothetical protein